MILRAILTTTTIIGLSAASAAAQQSQPSSAAYFVPSQSQAAAAQPMLPQGRSQSANNAMPQTRMSGYAGQRPSSYAVPAGQEVYRSQAYQGQRPQKAAPSGSDDRFGARVEGRLGWDHASMTGATAADDMDTNGVLFGLGAGYDHGFGNAFVGGFASIDWSSASSDATVTVTGTTTNTETTSETSVARDIELGVRAGYWVSRFANVYGLVALTNVKTENEVSVVTVTPEDTTAGTPELRSAATVTETDAFSDGWRIGAGSEVQFRGGVYAKAEYRYSDYGNDDDDSAELSRHQLVAGVGVRF